MQQLIVEIRKKSFSHLLLFLLCFLFTVTAEAKTLTQIAKLKINFPGLRNVHTDIRISDNIADSATGKSVKKSKWKNYGTTVRVPKGRYDLIIKKGAGELIIDNVDCSSNTCTVNNVVAKLTINFPGMKGVHSSVHVSDDVKNSASGKKVNHLFWQKNQAKITVLRQKYDLKIRKKAETIVVDNVDCSSGRCRVNDLIATMKVSFPDMKGVHTSVRVPDNVPNQAKGKEVTKKNWQNKLAKIVVFKKQYDLFLRKGGSLFIVDNVDCSSGNCFVDNLTTTLTVNFPGLSAVHTSVRTADNIKGSVNGNEVRHKNWQKNKAVFTLVPGVYDLRIRKGGDTVILDDIDCTTGNCRVDDITAQMTVKFPGMSRVNTSLHIPDNKDGTADGKKVAKKNGKTDQVIFSVFRQQYDIRVTKGPVTKIIDNIDCTSGTCNTNKLTAILSIEFPGLSSVHSSVHIPDSGANTADGPIASKSNRKNHHTKIALLRGTYDIKVRHSVDSIFDNVDCNNASCKVMVTGNVQAVLIDGDIKRPLAGKTLTAYEKMPDGTLQKVMNGKTTAQGQVNLTLQGITFGRVYVLKTTNPFGNGKSYFSTFITREGKHQFIITADGENSLDLTPPEVAMSSPQDGDSITNQGFLVTGTATDNREIERIELTVNDPVKGIHVVTGSYDAVSQSWSANVLESMITLNNKIVLTATAYDRAQSQSSATVAVTVVKDNEGPEITITSHTDNDEVPVTGFLLSGAVTDLNQVATLKVTLVDSGLGERLKGQDVKFSIDNGAWALGVDNGMISEGGVVDITFDATDTIGNASSKTIRILIVAVDFSNAHMINRITFGATPSLIQEVETLGALDFLEQQLNPDNIDDSEFAAMMGNMPTTKEELQAWTLRHMAFSKRQLREAMTWFWDNHFNTNINTTRTNAQDNELSNTVQYELAENQAFRANALGNFRDLLEISAKSPAMLIYLDSISNVAGDSNENYAREVKELHTMGVNGGYTAKDVENSAEIFTGWHVKNGAFSFMNSLHTIGSYRMFEDTAQEVLIPEGGVIQGEMLLDALAAHPSTANFICSKLVTLFVNDSPPDSLVTRCASEFLNFSSSSDQIEQVLRLILLSAEFNDAANYRAKIKTPVEFVIGAIRNLEATSDASDLIAPIRAMGIRLYENPVPTGWSEIGADWINASLLIERMKWVNDFARNEADANGSTSNPIQFYPGNGFETAEGIVGFLLQLTVGDDFTDLARANALNILGLNFNLADQDSEVKLRKLNSNVMSYPQYQFQ